MGGYLSQNEIDNLLQGLSNPGASQKDSSRQQVPAGGDATPAVERAVKKSPLVERVEFAPLQAQPPVLGAPKPPLDFFQNITLVLSGELGATKITVRDFLQLAVGSVIKLDKMAGESAAILLNGQYLGQAEVVVINDCFGLRVTAIGTGEGRAKKALPPEKEKKQPDSDSPVPLSEEGTEQED